MTKPNFLHELPIEQLRQMSQEEIDQTIKAEQLYWQHRPKTLYYLAVNGAKTKNGGLVKASTKACFIGGLAVARVGDEVIYADGTTSKIVSGSGKGCLLEGIAIALVGSHVENGDEIVDSPNNAVAMSVFKGDIPPEEFLILRGIQNNG